VCEWPQMLLSYRLAAEPLDKLAVYVSLDTPDPVLGAHVKTLDTLDLVLLVCLVGQVQTSFSASRTTVIAVLACEHGFSHRTVHAAGQDTPSVPNHVSYAQAGRRRRSRL